MSERRIDPTELPQCELCGEPMPPGESMFKFHGYSGPCPKPPLPRPEEPYKVTDNSGGITGRGWRVSGPAGFDVYSDRDEKIAREVCRQMNRAHAAALAEQAVEKDKRIAELDRQINRLLDHCADPECLTCGEIICPHQEPLHFHHDGCPMCDYKALSMKGGSE